MVRQELELELELELVLELVLERVQELEQVLVALNLASSRRQATEVMAPPAHRR